MEVGEIGLFIKGLTTGGGCLTAHRGERGLWGVCGGEGEEGEGRRRGGGGGKGEREGGGISQAFFSRPKNKIT